MADTLEQRAARVIQQAKELGLVLAEKDRAAWHALVTAEIVGALSVARDGCINIQDRIRIGELMLGMLPDRERRDTPRPMDPIAQAIADMPPGSSTIPCVACGGDPERKAGCAACHGLGVHAVSQAIPEGHTGTLATKPCGCAVDFVGDGIDPAYYAQRRAIWNELGYRTESVAWSEDLGKRMTAEAGCQHGKEPL